MNALLHRLRPIVALALLSVLGLGATGHAWHHFSDHACESRAAAGDEPCATCSKLHGGTILGDPQHGPAGRAIVCARVPLPPLSRAFATSLASAAPRAPPAA